MTTVQQDEQGAFIDFDWSCTTWRVLPEDARGPVRLCLTTATEEHYITLRKLSDLMSANGYYRIRKPVEVYGTGGQKKPSVRNGHMAIDSGYGRETKARTAEIVEALRAAGYVVLRKDDDATKRLFAAIRRQTVDAADGAPHGAAERAIVALDDASTQRNWEASNKASAEMLEAWGADVGELARAAQAVFGIDFTKEESVLEAR